MPALSPNLTSAQAHQEKQCFFTFAHICIIRVNHHGQPYRDAVTLTEVMYAERFEHLINVYGYFPRTKISLHE